MLPTLCNVVCLAGVINLMGTGPSTSKRNGTPATGRKSKVSFPCTPFTPTHWSQVGYSPCYILQVPSGISARSAEASTASYVTDGLSDISEKYSIDRKKSLGKGHYGTVYSCVSVDTNELFACKLIAKRKVKKLQQYVLSPSFHFA
jgi:hypothetical protein